MSCTAFGLRGEKLNLILTLAILAAALGWCAMAQANDLVLNGGFENLDRAEIPAHWTLKNRTKADLCTDGRYTWGGQNALRVTHNNNASQRFAVKGGVRYHASAWVKRVTENKKNACAQIYMTANCTLEDLQGTRVSHWSWLKGEAAGKTISCQRAATDEWRQIWAEFVPEQSGEINLILMSTDLKDENEVWFDNVSVEEGVSLRMFARRIPEKKELEKI